MEDVFLKALDLLKQMHDHGYVRQSVEEKNVIVINLDDDKLRRVGFMVME